LDEISWGWHLAAFKERGRLREIFIAKKINERLDFT
jgi:hypothetical protein